MCLQLITHMGGRGEGEGGGGVNDQSVTPLEKRDKNIT